ncbi:MAG: hypothetical protein ACRER8_12365 [Pseudomonas sp.]
MAVPLSQLSPQHVALNRHVVMHVDQLGHVLPIPAQFLLEHVAFLSKQARLLLEHFLAGEFVGPFGFG